MKVHRSWLQSALPVDTEKWTKLLSPRPVLSTIEQKLNDADRFGSFASSVHESTKLIWAVSVAQTSEAVNSLNDLSCCRHKVPQSSQSCLHVAESLYENKFLNRAKVEI
jgi:hypothetical protein